MATKGTIEERASWWLRCGDVGLSAKSIYLHMTGATINPNAFRYYGSNDQHWPFPNDSDDFGRCVALLDLIPEWFPRIGEMEQHGKVWEVLASCWDKIEKLYILEKPPDDDTADDHPQTSSLISEIIKKVICEY
jgi:hypothetical protein